jgi:hypothetical protein
MDEWDSAPIMDLPTTTPIDDDEWSSAPVIDVDKKGLKRSEIAAIPEKVAAVRNYLVDRSGVQWEEKTDDEVLDRFFGHMRNVGVNEVHTIGEARYVMGANDEQKVRAAQAFTVWEEMAPFWASGEGHEAVIDYGKAILTSPSTYLGAVFGKVATMGATKVAGQATVQVAKQALKTQGINAAKQALAQGAKAKAAYVVGKPSLMAVGVAGATDAGTATFQDVAYQNIMKEVGVQDKHNWAQTVLSGALGGLPGTAAGAMAEFRPAKVGFTRDTIESAKNARIQQASGFAAKRIKKSVEKLSAKVQNMPRGQADWDTLIKGGAQQNAPINDLMNATSWFFDVDDPDSILRIIVDSGAPLKFDDDVRFSEQLIEFVKGIEPKELDEINKVLEPAMGLKLGQLVENIAAGQSFGGSMLQRAQQAKKYAQSAAKQAAAMRIVDDNLLAGLKNSLVKEDPNAVSMAHARYAGSLWRRMLVSHPGTTAVNILGWGMGTSARALAEMFNGGIIGAVGLGGKAVGAGWSNQALRESKALFQNQIFKAKTLMDPYGSREAFDALLEMAPEGVQRRLASDSFGGVTREGVLESYGLSDNTLYKGTEWVADKAALLSLIKVQDTFTKTFSALGSLDKMSRIEYGKGITELMQSGEYYKITDDMWQRSLKDALTDTFSMDYTQPGKSINDKGFFGAMASVTETLSNAPVLGFLFPFGRFMNNNIAFALQYSPLAFAPITAKAFKHGPKALLDEGFTHDISKAMVGTMALGTLMNESMKLQEQGFQWYEHPDSSGTGITTQENMAPLSMMRILARMGGNLKEGKSIPREMWKELYDQIGPAQWANEISGDTPVGQLVGWATRENNPELVNGFGELLAGAVSAVSNQVIGGFTRPLDPLNKAVGMMNETDASIDRRQAETGGEEIALQILRYTDNMFDSVLEEPIGTTARSATRPEGDIKDPNPVASMTGRKELPPKNHIDKLLGMVDMPPFLFDTRTGSPEADRFLNERVGPLLNMRAKHLMKDEVFQKAPQAIKKDLAKNLLSNVKEDIRKQLQSGAIGSMEDRLDDERRMWMMQPQALRDEARTQLNIGTKDRELTENELRQLRAYVGDRNKFYQGITQ